jgi:predicted TIM-barrel enzyme
MFFGATAFAEAPFSAEGIINQTIELTGVQADITVDSVGIIAGGNVDVATGAEVDLESTVNTVEITANADVDVSTNILITALGDADVYYDVAIDVSTNLLESTVNSVSCFYWS